MLADFLVDNAFFGARRLVFSSASSKTAYGTAFCLQDTQGLTLTALTSDGNRAFVDGLGCYHDSVTYDALDTLTTDVPTLYVDFSGDTALRRRVHEHFGDALVYDCFAGSAQNTDFIQAADLPGPAPQFYFAPVQIRKRNADWGPAVVTEKFNAAQRRFIHHVRDPKHGWLTLIQEHGMPAAQARIAALHAGRTHPREGYVIRL